jgi:hypothetical protein
MPLNFLRAPQALSIVISCAAFAWCVYLLPKSEDIDKFLYLKDQLLRSDIYEPTQTKRTYIELESVDLGNCEAEAQTSLLLLQLHLVENSLRTGAAAQFDEQLYDLTAHVSRALSCTPRLSYLWLLCFWSRTLSGLLDQRSIEILAMSYETGPNEGWIAIRRNALAMAIVPLAPDQLAQRIIKEFGLLVRDGFLPEAAASYSVAALPVRSALQNELFRLSNSRQTEFWQAVRARNPRLGPLGEGN